MKLSDLQKTYCNPLPIPQIPWGCDDWINNTFGMFSEEKKPENVTVPDYRSISDPTVFYWDQKWYLYPSYGMAWVSEDFCTWKHVRTEPYCPKYSPSIIPWKDRFLMTSWGCPLYEADSPVGPFRELGAFKKLDGTDYRPCDPGIFRDEDGRIYLYAFNMDRRGGDDISQIIGFELDRDDPRRIVQGPIVLMEIHPELHPWERGGNFNQNTRFGWLEGPHLVRHGARYYLICAAPNTEFEPYCQEVFYADSPLGSFVCQKRNPLTIHRTGIVRGCGHGCVEHGPDNSLWAFYTVAVPYQHKFERRIGMDRVEIDENGEMYCPAGITDVPAFAPGQPKSGQPVGYLPLNGWSRPTASSQAPGRDSLYACDGSALTFWLPDGQDAAPVLTCDLDADYRVGAMRVFWRDVGLDYTKGIRPGPIGYILEGCADKERKNWFTLLDRSASEEELNIDYRVFEEKICTSVRLRIVSAPKGIQPGVIDFTVFGYRG